MTTYVLLTIDKKGNVKNIVTGISCAMLKMYAMNHEVKTRSHLIFSGDNYECESAFLWGKLPNENDLTGTKCVDFGIPAEMIDELVNDHNKGRR